MSGRRLCLRKQAGNQQPYVDALLRLRGLKNVKGMWREMKSIEELRGPRKTGHYVNNLGIVDPTTRSDQIEMALSTACVGAAG